MARGVHMPVWQELRPHVAGGMQQSQRAGYALISMACTTSHGDGRCFGCVPFDFHISCRLFHGFICTEQGQSRKGQRQDCVHLFFHREPFLCKGAACAVPFFACHWPISSSMSFSRVRPVSMSSSRSSTSPLIRSVSTTMRALTFFILPLE